jgi:hypothetical protein
MNEAPPPSPPPPPPPPDVGLLSNSTCGLHSVVAGACPALGAAVTTVCAGRMCVAALLLTVPAQMTAHWCR